MSRDGTLSPTPIGDSTIQARAGAADRARDDAVGGRRVLIVDDEAYAVRTLEQMLRRNGFREVRSTTDPRLALAIFDEFMPDLVIVDLVMKGLDGYTVIEQVQQRIPEGRFVPIIVISGLLAPEAKQKALELGASDFVEKPFAQAEVCLRVRNLLELHDLTSRLDARVAERTRELQRSELELAMRLALAAELRDYHDGAHVQRVGRISALIARHLGLPAARVELIRQAAPLHDIGKVAIPDSILLKPGALTLEEWDVMKTHTTVGAQILSGSRSPILQLAEEISLYHHENWDGTGYTPGLGGEDIPLAGRIVAVADVFDALSRARPYKKAWSTERSVAQMRRLRGTKFDPHVLDCLLEAVGTDELAGLAAEPDTASMLAQLAARNLSPLPLLE